MEYIDQIRYIVCLVLHLLSSFTLKSRKAFREAIFGHIFLWLFLS